MKQFKKRSSLLTIVGVVSFALLSGILISFTTKTEVSQMQRVNDDDEGFKNLQVLPKNISMDSLDNLMHGYSISLGVKCSYCHESNANGKGLNFAGDGKVQKNIARDMIRMNNEINMKYFNPDGSRKVTEIHEVNCMTCHNGHKSPTDYMRDVVKLKQLQDNPNGEN